MVPLTVSPPFLAAAVRFYPMANMPGPLDASLQPSAPKKARRRAR